MHNLPLTIYDPTLPFNAHEGEGVTLAFADRPDEALKALCRGAGHRPAGFHLCLGAGGAPRRDRTLAETVEVRPVRDTLK